MKPAVLVLGATGTMGRAVVREALAAGSPVVAVAREAAALQELARNYPGAPLQTLVASVSDDESADALVAALQKLGRPFAGVISALGSGRERGRLLDQPVERLRNVFDDAVMPQLIAARHLLPWLAATGRNASYVLIGGPGGRHPWAGYGHRSIAAAALRMLARVLHTEARAFAVRLQLLEVESPVRTEANSQHACPQWPSAEAIGRKALALLERRGEARCGQAVIDYATEACIERAAADECPSKARAGKEREQGRESAAETPAGSDPGAAAPKRDLPQEPDSSASLLPARCLQDARKLLETFTPTKKNQERTQ